jgi:chemotaxis protein MotA
MKDVMRFMDADAEFIDLDEGGVIDQLIVLSEKSRREGLLSLEEGLGGIHCKFLRDALSLVIDGVDPSVVRSIADDRKAAIMDLTRRFHDAVLLALSGRASKEAGRILPEYLDALFLPGALRETIIDLHAASAGRGSSKERNADSQPPGIERILAIARMKIDPARRGMLVERTLEGVRRRNGVLMDIIVKGVAGIQAGETPRILMERLTALLDPETAARITRE